MLYPIWPLRLCDKNVTRDQIGGLVFSLAIDRNTSHEATFFFWILKHETGKIRNGLSYVTHNVGFRINTCFCAACNYGVG